LSLPTGLQGQSAEATRRVDAKTAQSVQSVQTAESAQPSPLSPPIDDPDPDPDPASQPLQFVLEGMRHILSGYDHVLFLFCLLLPSVMRRRNDQWEAVESLAQAVLPLLGVVTSFTVAHSITLALAATGTVSLPPSVIEPTIAATIIVAAIDNVWPIFPRRRTVVTFVFGLIHGFGFATVLAELHLQPRQFAVALLQFNVGLELGQLLIVVVATSLLYGLRRRSSYPALFIRGGSVVSILVGAGWLIERTTNIALMPF
jgi:hypothetical protein